ncbi:potassium uptake protein Trk family [Dialister sp. CAG:357]|uniref:SLC13 family permease n=1 Tax=Dialister sp. CAG:357 TaxID=1262869 RepID=UPI0003373C5F|nr:SLC13 family permease [Dialister sp. CAG:357]CDD79844.1 potassium uptake protein Trk family [Dialister sp. CAG:357]
MDPAIITLCVLAVAAFLFVTELIPLAVTAMAACTMLGILGVLPAKQVYAGLSNSTVVLFGGMFVIGAAMFKTGLAEAIGIAVVKKAGTGEIRLMGAIMLVTIILSSVSSNTGTVACLMPVIVGICQAAKIPASKELMPLAIAANVGGTITMIGTPPNVIVTGALSAAGLPTFGFFEFAYIGIPLSAIIFFWTLFVGRHFLPDKSAGAMDEEAVKAAKEEAGAGDDNAPKSKTKMWISGLILIGVVLAMALEIPTLPLQTAAVTGAILCVITGCLKEKEAYAGIDWVTIFLFAGMLSVATAMEKTGAGKLIADTVVNMMGDNPNPYVLTAVLFLISKGCLKEKEAYAGIDWVTIFLFAGMLSVATAMDKTGAGKLIADTVVGMMGSNPNPYVLTAVLFLISNILTQFMSNTASAALLAPIGISIAQSIGVDPKPVLMALGIAASCAFATPMATPPNTLVLGPGNFTFNDYVKVGVPMCLLSWVACVVIIPIFWPFH